MFEGKGGFFAAIADFTSSLGAGERFLVNATRSGQVRVTVTLTDLSTYNIRMLVMSEHNAVRQSNFALL